MATIDDVLAGAPIPADYDWQAHDREIRLRLEADLASAIRRASSTVSKVPEGDPDMVTHWAMKFLVRDLSD